jgi:outer membrane protein OmpA-like peptidoglycan-associated protein
LALFGDLQLDPVIEKNSIIQIRNIYFDFDKATIREESFKVLAQIIIFLNENPNIRVELSAHTDARGSDAYNLKLSQKRAESTVNYLVERGIDPSRLVPKGYGEKKIQNQCKNGVKCSEEEHEMNRRVELKVL